MGVRLIIRVLRLFLVLSAVLTATTAVVSVPAGADCGGPTLTFDPHDVNRGDTIQLIGSFWGDNCYDTGPPPDGEGGLGNPIADIQVVLQQGSRQWELWSGSANDSYEFAAIVTIPADTSPGEATITALWARSDQEEWISAFTPDPTLRIDDGPPSSTTSSTTEVASSDHGGPAAAAVEAQSRSRGAIWIAAVGAVVVGGLAIWTRRRRKA